MMATTSSTGLSSVIAQYSDSSDDDTEKDTQPTKQQHKIDEQEVGLHLRKQTQIIRALTAAPDVVESNNAFKFSIKEDGTIDSNMLTVDPNADQISFNATYNQLFKQASGPARPRGEKMIKNVANGYLQNSAVNETIFEDQRRQFSLFQKLDPKSAKQISVTGVKLRKSQLVSRTGNCPKSGQKRDKAYNMDAGDIEGYTGMGWADFKDVVQEEGPDEKDRATLDEYLVKMRKKGYKCRRMNFLSKNAPEDEDERFELHVPQDEVVDYQGRSWLDIDAVKQTQQVPTQKPQKCFMPKKMIHKYTAPVAEGGKKGLTQLRTSEAAPHVFVTAGFDGVSRIFRLYGKRKLMASYYGHQAAIKDLWMTKDAKQFITASFDRYCRYWDTETGKCLGKYTTNTPVNVARINPIEEWVFLAGQTNKHIIQWDTRMDPEKANILSYERHTKAVNTITWIDGGKKLMTSADDKTIRCWEYGIPVDYRLIADPEMHSMPSATLSPNGTFVGYQSMDNKVLIYDLTAGRIKLLRKRIFRGHMTAGYACQVDWSPDQEYFISGDGDGKIFMWDFRRLKLLSRFKAHDAVTIGVKSLPFETSKLLSWSWDGTVKLWD